MRHQFRGNPDLSQDKILFAGFPEPGRGQRKIQTIKQLQREHRRRQEGHRQGVCHQLRIAVKARFLAGNDQPCPGVGRRDPDGLPCKRQYFLTVFLPFVFLRGSPLENPCTAVIKINPPMRDPATRSPAGLLELRDLLRRYCLALLYPVQNPVAHYCQESRRRAGNRHAGVCVTTHEKS